MSDKKKRYMLPEEEIPHYWYNIQADMVNKPMPTNMLLMPLLRISVAAASLKKFSGSCCPLARACSARRYLAFRFL